MELETGMNQQERAAISGAMEKLLADTYVLYVKTQNAHWNITGPEFFSLHKLLEKQYEELAEVIDETAERIRALGFYVEGTIEAFKKLSSIREDSRVLAKHEILEQLVKAHEVVIREARKLNDLAERNHDPATIDMIGRRLNLHEKAAWMLRSSL